MKIILFIIILVAVEVNKHTVVQIHWQLVLSVLKRIQNIKNTLLAMNLE